MKKIAICLTLLSLILFGVLMFKQFSIASMESQVDANMAKILRADMPYSSNPYYYIKNNADFHNIVQLGQDVLPILQDKIKNSENDGLQEYILAIAIERIAQTNLKMSKETTWETAKGFTQQLKGY